MDEARLPWRAAMERALYAPGTGFFTSGRAAPADHFRTSVHASGRYADAVARLLAAVDDELGRPAAVDLVDVAAGRGELLRAVLAAVPAGLAERLRPTGVELAGRPAGLPDRIAWVDRPPASVTGLVVANEWLDNVPLDVVEVDPAGTPRYVTVTPDGGQSLAGPVAGRSAAGPVAGRSAAGPVAARSPAAPVEGRSPAGPVAGRSAAGPVAGRSAAGPVEGRSPAGPVDGDWLDRWWPLAGAPPGTRAEVGGTRDAAWVSVLARLRRGMAVAVDYGHLRDARPPLGTLTGFRGGAEVAPVPDGSCDLTAHVAVDAVADAGARRLGVPPVLLRQRAALHRLGLSGARPALALATRDPAGYLRALAAASAAAELTDPAGLGGFWWIVQPTAELAGLAHRLFGAVATDR